MMASQDGLGSVLSLGVFWKESTLFWGLVLFQWFLELANKAIWSWPFAYWGIFEDWIDLFTPYRSVQIFISSWVGLGNFCPQDSFHFPRSPNLLAYNCFQHSLMILSTSVRVVVMYPLLFLNLAIYTISPFLVNELRVWQFCLLKKKCSVWFCWFYFFSLSSTMMITIVTFSISTPLVTLGLVCSSFASKVRLPTEIFYFSFFTLGLFTYKSPFEGCFLLRS